MLAIRITRHAYRQAKKKMRIKPRTLERIAERAFNEGFRDNSIHDQLQLEGRYPTGTYTAMILKEIIYIFSGNNLVIVYRNNSKKELLK